MTFVVDGFQHANGLVRARVDRGMWIVECADPGGAWTVADLKRVRIPVGDDLDASRALAEATVAAYGEKLADLRDLRALERQADQELRAWLYEQRDVNGTLMPAETPVPVDEPTDEDQPAAE